MEKRGLNKKEEVTMKLSRSFFINGGGTSMLYKSYYYFEYPFGDIPYMEMAYFSAFKKYA